MPFIRELSIEKIIKIFFHPTLASTQSPAKINKIIKNQAHSGKKTCNFCSEPAEFLC